MQNWGKILYQISIVIFVVMITISMILPFIIGSYERLGYPYHIKFVLPVYKVLGLTAILTNKSIRLAEWAFAGFILLLILAIFSHIMAGDQIWFIPAIPLTALSYIYYYRYRFTAFGIQYEQITSNK